MTQYLLNALICVCSGNTDRNELIALTFDTGWSTSNWLNDKYMYVSDHKDNHGVFKMTRLSDISGMNVIIKDKNTNSLYVYNYLFIYCSIIHILHHQGIISIS